MVSYFGPVHQFGPYYLNGLIIESVEAQKNLGMLLGNQLKFHSHTAEVAAKANRLLGSIGKSFDHLDLDMLTNPWCVLHWNTVIRHGGHPLLLTKGR